MGCTSHFHSRQFELSGDHWTDRFIAAHEWAQEEAEAAKKSKGEESKRVIHEGEERVSNILESK